MIKKSIGTNAGVIWQLLLEKGRLSIKEIENGIDIELLDMGLALGWLARENKVRFIENDEISYVEIMNIPTDIFY